MPGQFVQPYWVHLEVAGSGDGVHESDGELFWSCCGRLGAVIEEVALFAKVAKFVVL